MPERMKIRLISGIGVGPTESVAYLEALKAAQREESLSPATPHIAQSRMVQSQPGRWAHAALGWQQDEQTGQTLFVELQHDNLARLQRELYAAALAKRHDTNPRLGQLHAKFASVPCRGQPACAVVLAACVENEEQMS